MKRKLVIIIQDTTEDGCFSLYLDGDKGRLSDPKVPDDDLTPAEYWGAKMYHLCLDLVRQRNLVTKEIDTEIIH